MVPWEQPEGAAGNAPRSSRMNEGLRAKKLPCGHILHLRCLKAWLERQQSCPTCRRPVISAPNPQAPAAPGQPDAPAGNAPAQPPAPGAYAAPGAAQAQVDGAGAGPGAQPAPRQNRLRMLNLGPIRIGVYNGPANQVQDALAQRNQQAQPQGPAAAVRATGNAPMIGTASTQVQLMQIEERLMHEARNLSIEQSQLATARALEAELARLRAEHHRGQLSASVGATAAGLGVAPVPGARTQFPYAGYGMGPPTYAPFGGFALPQAFQPLPQQAALANGHPDLPQGLTLPEGWTLTPLHRVGGLPQHEVSMSGPQSTNGLSAPTTVLEGAAPEAAPFSTSTTTTSTPANAESAIDSAPAISSAQADTQIPEPSSSASSNASVPNGATSHSDPTASSSSSSRGDTVPQSDAQQPSSSSDPKEEQAPWTNTPSWGFDWADRATGNTNGSETETQATSEANGSHDNTGASSSGKGKGKAVSIEDVEDAGE